jgi:hypothetical protein
MVDAMETVPTLVHLGLGTLRDAGMRWRVQSMQSRALERLRQERIRRVAASGAGGGAGAGNEGSGASGAPSSSLSSSSSSTATCTKSSSADSLGRTQRRSLKGVGSGSGGGGQEEEPLIAPSKLRAIASTIDAAIRSGGDEAYTDSGWQAEVARYVARSEEEFEAEEALEEAEEAEVEVAEAEEAVAAAAEAERGERQKL